ncbi:alpha-(1,3)-fucosyltransferase C-like [Elysia marginata]|uniref:Fucosyltransferase n=1 Tax=Elysia marginata TaxID=1093978 RepID=A0AAV4G4W7_9GAST|nr:alpha-(1,3)-fucosyltransferase C-like [Elysia marginata]
MCRWEVNNSLADAVLFRAGAIRTWVIKPFPRKPGSRWIMYTNDPAIKNYGLDRDDVGSNFNATSTYQLHSDYPRLFGQLRRVKPPAKDYGRIFDGKTRQIAWFVSHCSTWSKRELYIERMRKIIPVDVFGACGNLTCGASHYRGNDTNVCLPMLSEHYKYYLAFENSFCKDYVSEKFFKLFQGVDVIPVVQGGFDYHRYMPSKTPEALAHYLLDLSHDKYRYVKMLKRKARWTYKAAEPMHCVVCEQLHRDHRVYHHTDMVAVFNGKPPECYGPRWLQRAEEKDGEEEEDEDDEVQEVEEGEE